MLGIVNAGGDGTCYGIGCFQRFSLLADRSCVWHWMRTYRLPVAKVCG